MSGSNTPREYNYDLSQKFTDAVALVYADIRDPRTLKGYDNMPKYIQEGFQDMFFASHIWDTNIHHKIWNIMSDAHTPAEIATANAVAKGMITAYIDGIQQIMRIHPDNTSVFKKNKSTPDARNTFFEGIQWRLHGAIDTATSQYMEVLKWKNALAIISNVNKLFQATVPPPPTSSSKQ